MGCQLAVSLTLKWLLVRQGPGQQQLAANCHLTLGSNKMATRRSRSTTSLQSNGVKIAITCDKTD